MEKRKREGEREREKKQEKAREKREEDSLYIFVCVYIWRNVFGKEQKWNGKDFT